MFFRHLKIGYRLGWTFALLIAVFAVANAINAYYLQKLAEYERNLYRHPFTVSTAILRIDGSIVRMHHIMRGLVLSKDEQELEGAITAIADLEWKVFKDLDLVYERFLGEKTKVDELRSLLNGWKPIRDSAIEHLRRGENQIALDITYGKASEYVKKLTLTINEFILFARNKADTFHANAEAQHQEAIFISFLLFFIGILVSIALAVFNTRSIVYPIRRLSSVAGKIAAGDLSSRVGFQGTDEFGQLARVFDQMASQTEESIWVQSSSTDLMTHLQRAENLPDLAESLIRYLTPLLQGGHGVVYLLDEQSGRYELQASYGYEHRKNLRTSFAPGEGLIGQCVREKRPIRLNNVPDDYVLISSGLGEGKPLSIYAFPILSHEQVLCVMEIAAFQSFSSAQLAVLKESSQSISLIMENLRRSYRAQELLKQTQAQAEKLSAQQEELRQANEVMKKQTDSLQASEEELRIQQDNLSAANRNLQEKTQRLMDEQSAREQANQVLQQKALELEQASRYKSEFLANMSHELRTPLNSLLILAKSFSQNREGNLQPGQIEAARIIHASGEDLLRLINDILDLAKIEAGRMELHLETMNLTEFSHVLVEQVRPMAETKGLEFEVSIEPELPDHFYTDWERCGQILKNLLANAIKFCQEGSVSIHFQRPDPASLPPPPANFPKEGLAVLVTDTGIGIPEDKIQIIFEAFQQGDGTTNRHFGGTGLGLSISLELAKALGGSIAVHSQEGKGSTFALFLPAQGTRLEKNPEILNKVLAASPLPTPASPEIVPLVADDRKSLLPRDPSILIIEDDQNFARTICLLFHEKGFKCVVATDGRTGLSLAMQHQPIGIILDLGLPDLDGWSVLDCLKQNSETRHIPVHIVSGQEHLADEMQKGAIGFLRKPVSSSQLEMALDRIQYFHTSKIRELLVVEDNLAAQKAIISLLDNDTINITTTATGEEASTLLKDRHFDCMILDLGLPDMTGFELLDRLHDLPEVHKPPVVVYSGRDLSRDEYQHLQHYTDSIVIKGAKSADRLLDEVVLFLHSVEEKLPESQRQMLRQVHDPEQTLLNKKVLLVDDDVRNTFALSRTLELNGLKVMISASGQKALEILADNSDIQLVLMDIMMPEMDGYQTMQEIRKTRSMQKLPIIAVTAKAMLEDRERCLAAGANDYLPKPIDTDRLLSMMRVWLY
ncbi:MAG: response regulator [Magnetococcales bacterium]|nr:response regulator [Magnetococcales bacterium]